MSDRTSHRIVRYVNTILDRPAPSSCRVTVDLRHESGERYVGVAEGSCFSEGEMKLSARAAVEAVRQAASMNDGELTFGDASLTAITGHPSILVVIHVTRDGQATSLLGSCFAGNDHCRAAALAVLNATNRFLGLTS